MSVRFKLLGLLLGVGLAVYGFKERTLSAAASETPQRLTCAQLGERGYGDNAHVVLTDFAFTVDFVYSEKSGKWKQVWIPAVPLDGEYAEKVRAAGGDPTKVPAPRPVLVIVTSTDVANQAALSALEEKDELQGLVTNVIDKIDGKTKDLLEKAYGDVSRAQIFEVGRKVKGTGLILGMIAGGCILGLASLGSFFLRKKKTEDAG
jgi:hypothetical protein